MRPIRNLKWLLTILSGIGFIFISYYLYPYFFSTEKNFWGLTRLSGSSDSTPTEKDAIAQNGANEKIRIGFIEKVTSKKELCTTTQTSALSTHSICDMQEGSSGGASATTTITNAITTKTDIIYPTDEQEDEDEEEEEEEVEDDDDESNRDSSNTKELETITTTSSGTSSNMPLFSKPPPPPPKPVPEIPSRPPQTGYKSVVYFCNWAIYARKHYPSELPVERITHILYAFADVKSETGEVRLSDDWADKDCELGPPPATPTPDGQPRKGCFGEFYKLKEQNRHFRILLSIGGWSFSWNFLNGVSNPDKRKTFAQSAVAMVEKYSLDGLDLDWEYPPGPVEAQWYVDLCREVRMELDASAMRQGLPRGQYDLTVAAPGGPEQSRILNIAAMDPYLTFWNIMSYDFCGPWADKTGYHSNLYGGELSAEVATRAYLDAGVSPEKLVFGMPNYGRSFGNTSGVGHKFQGTGGGTWEDGVWDYKALPLSGATEHVDNQAVSAYCYDKKNKTFVGYDNAHTAKVKANFVKKHHLGGVMFWESSGDLGANDPRSLITSFTDSLGINNLDKRMNSLVREPAQGPNYNNTSRSQLPPPPPPPRPYFHQ